MEREKVKALVVYLLEECDKRGVDANMAVSIPYVLRRTVEKEIKAQKKAQSILDTFARIIPRLTPKDKEQLMYIGDAMINETI